MVEPANDNDSKKKKIENKGSMPIKKSIKNRSLSILYILKAIRIKPKEIPENKGIIKIFSVGINMYPKLIW